MPYIVFWKLFFDPKFFGLFVRTNISTKDNVHQGRYIGIITRIAVEDGRLIGVCRLWPIIVGADKIPALFVGPVAIDPDFQGQRLGLTVTGEALEAATKAGWGAAVIIGSPRYFSELGFTVVAPDRFQFPGPQDMSRVMVRALAGSADELSGALRAY